MNTKKILLIFFSLAFIVIVCAFKFEAKQETTVKKKWTTSDEFYYFSYVGPNYPSYPSQEYFDTDNYIMVNQEPNEFECGYGSDEICAIAAPRIWNGYEWKPDLSSTSYGTTGWHLLNYISSRASLNGPAIWTKDL